MSRLCQILQAVLFLVVLLKCSVSSDEVMIDNSLEKLFENPSTTGPSEYIKPVGNILNVRCKKDSLDIVEGVGVLSRVNPTFEKFPRPMFVLPHQADDCRAGFRSAALHGRRLGSPLSPSSSAAGDQRTSSVAELRRKAQEHSAALLQSLQHVANFQQAAAAGLNFPLLPPLTLQAALQRKHDEDKAADAAAAAAAKDAGGAS